MKMGVLLRKSGGFAIEMGGFTMKMGVLMGFYLGKGGGLL
jgi:hypothetical protein